ncbi:MAG: hypothetical protein AB7Q16_18000 [Vicinamibacterales bacterium]
MASHPAATPISKPYEPQPYPSMRYRRGADGAVERCRVDNADQDAALGPEWTDSPATVDTPALAAAKADGKSDEGKKTKPAAKPAGDSQ